MDAQARDEARRNTPFDDSPEHRAVAEAIRVAGAGESVRIVEPLNQRSFHTAIVRRADSGGGPRRVLVRLSSASHSAPAVPPDAGGKRGANPRRGASASNPPHEIRKRFRRR